MVKDGFYRVSFSASALGTGGLIVVESGRVRGGDAQFLYSGNLESSDGKLSLKLAVHPYVANAQSVFKRQGPFILDLTGDVVGDQVNLKGPSPFGAGPGIQIHASFLAPPTL